MSPCASSSASFHPVSATDYLPRHQLEQLQLTRLQRTVHAAYASVGLYRERMDNAGISPGDIRTLDDMEGMPFTMKADLRDGYPFGLFAVPIDDVVRLHASSGTTGKPIVVSYTRKDLEVWSEVIMRTFACCGLGRGDIIQNAYGYGLFTGGLGIHYGAETLGATVIPISGGNTDRQLMVMKDFGVTAICCTPSYFLHVVERAAEMGIAMQDLRLKAGVFGAEPWTDAMRKRIETAGNIRAYDIYGLSEIIGPGVGSECGQQAGLHLFEDHFLAEIIDPDTGKRVPDGTEGELVITTLSKQAMPMLRYRTRDITAVIPDRCACGRNLRRIKRISRRSDDMFIVRGVNVYPSQVETALLMAEGTLPHYLIRLAREDGLDRMIVDVEVTSDVFSDTVGGLEQLQRDIIHSIERVVGLRAVVRLVEPNTLERSAGKAKRVSDERGL